MRDAPRTAPVLPRLAADCWHRLFDNDRPVAVEIGPGRGDFLLATARAFPERNYFAIERSRSHARLIEDKLACAGVANARVLEGDAACIIAMLPDACVAAYHVQFPDPWWKRRHHRRRIWTPAFVAELRRTLVAGGTVELLTDVESTFALAQQFLGADPGLTVRTVGPAAAVDTSFARKARRLGTSIYRSVHVKRAAGSG